MKLYIAGIMVGILLGWCWHTEYLRYRITWRGFRKDRLFPFWIYKVVPGFKHISEYANEDLHISDFDFGSAQGTTIWLEPKAKS